LTVTHKTGKNTLDRDAKKEEKTPESDEEKEKITLYIVAADAIQKKEKKHSNLRWPHGSSGGAGSHFPRGAAESRARALRCWFSSGLGRVWVRFSAENLVLEHCIVGVIRV
jgi:hypothetical protein